MIYKIPQVAESGNFFVEGIILIGHVNVKSCVLNLPSNINQQACSTECWTANQNWPSIVKWGWLGVSNK